MKQLLIMTAVLALAAGTVARAGDEASHAASAPPAAQSLYVCPDRDSAAMAAGQCKGCGKDLVSMKVLAVKDGKGTVCECASSCADCKLDANDASKCSCGKKAGTVPLKGLYTCAHGHCNAVSDKAGQCGCGADMVQAE